MVSRREELNELFKEITNNVYFQPPESVKLKYPCIIYNLNSADSQYADDFAYRFKRRYDVMYITKNPDDENVDKIAKYFKYIKFDRWFASGGLNHYNYNLYY